MLTPITLANSSNEPCPFRIFPSDPRNTPKASINPLMKFPNPVRKVSTSFGIAHPRIAATVRSIKSVIVVMMVRKTLAFCCIALASAPFSSMSSASPLICCRCSLALSRSFFSVPAFRSIPLWADSAAESSSVSSPPPNRFMIQLQISLKKFPISCQSSQPTISFQAPSTPDLTSFRNLTNPLSSPFSLKVNQVITTLAFSAIHPQMSPKNLPIAFQPSHAVTTPQIRPTSEATSLMNFVNPLSLPSSL